eukprot:CAMPEP_0185847736 /NCGR_PEP_ID=MMETSP1354-20130828/2895_1 /TAXON_ID=708628 /ORGANISM="Erythrolobus madagascarensis, Strain CCMP3276" /LENGTH=318 /DNA_ID=CAMNT_0028548065 /DNA_START=155 /DNA_END=1111 /DNA_ORIENTATION=-
MLMCAFAPVGLGNGAGVKQRHRSVCFVRRGASAFSNRRKVQDAAVAPTRSVRRNVCGPRMVSDKVDVMRGLPSVDVLAQRVVVIFSDYLSDLIVLDMIDRIDSMYDIALVVVGTLVAYSLADLSSGTIYLVLDKHRGNLPSRPSPEHEQPHHHSRPRGVKKLHLYEAWKGDFFARCWQPCLWATPFLSIVAGWQPDNLGLEALCVMYMSLLAIMPQLRQWSHVPSPPAPVRLLQQMGVLYRVPHGRTAGFCCISGWWNPVLDFLAMAPLPVRTNQQPQNPNHSSSSSSASVLPDSSSTNMVGAPVEVERIVASRANRR